MVVGVVVGDNWSDVWVVDCIFSESDVLWRSETIVVFASGGRSTKGEGGKGRVVFVVAARDLFVDILFGVG